MILWWKLIFVEKNIFSLASSTVFFCCKGFPQPGSKKSMLWYITSTSSNNNLHYLIISILSTGLFTCPACGRTWTGSRHCRYSPARFPSPSPCSWKKREKIKTKNRVNNFWFYHREQISEKWTKQIWKTKNFRHRDYLLFFQNQCPPEPIMGKCLSVRILRSQLTPRD